MKHLFIARHGAYDEDKQLSEEGREQIATLGGSIREILNGGSTRIVSSTVPRAVSSARVLVDYLGLPIDFEENSYLFRLNFEVGSVRYANSMAFIDERRNHINGLVLMTHDDIVGLLSTYFMKKEWSESCPINSIRLAHAVHFDLENKLCQVLPK